MRRGMRVLVIEDSKVRDSFDHRSRVRSTGRHHQGGDSLAVRVEFYFAWSWFCMHHGFWRTKGARHLGDNPVCASNSKHIDVRHHFLRELVSRGEFDIVAVESEQQHADFLTKALAGPVFRFHRDFVMDFLFWENGRICHDLVR